MDLLIASVRRCIKRVKGHPSGKTYEALCPHSTTELFIGTGGRYEETVVFDPKNIDTKNVREIKPAHRINREATRLLGNVPKKPNQ